jgi:ornithine cyclodeaminase/alanine dehydrogenase-like protein (mu-crystallin family)
VQTLPFVDAAAVRAATPWPDLVAALRDAFRQGCVLPPRHHHAFEVPGERDGTLLLMPAWRTGGTLGVKVVNIVPGNDARGLPAVSAVYLLFSAATGRPLALLDGAELTARRTAAASALAAGFLARADAARLLVVGTGRLAPELAAAHASVRPVREVAVWGRSGGKAEELAARLGRELGLEARATADLEAAVRAADIVSTGTTSLEPLVRGAWLKEGAHLDLVGGFTPAMREADDEAVRRARVWVDTLDGALAEAGDIVQPLRSGVLAREAVVGDLLGLCRGEVAGRENPAEITMFKSVGTALEDLAAATLVAGRNL